MKRLQIVEQIHQALRQVAPDAKTMLYGSEARGDVRPDSDIEIGTIGVQINARIILKKIWKSLLFRTPFHINVINKGIA